MARRKKYTEEEKAILIEEAKRARKKSAMKTGARIAGISMIAGAMLVIATKKVFDEVFVEEDWSDVDWGEDEEDYEVY